MISIALPNIANNFHLSIKNSESIINSFLVSAVGSFILFGRIGDRIGHHNMLISGMVIFLMGTILCSFGHNLMFFLAGRILQGLGFSGSFLMSIILINRIFPEKRRSLFIGVTTTISGLTQAIGPCVSTVILHFLDWRYLFLFKIPFIVLGIFFCRIFVPVFKGNYPKKVNYTKEDHLLIGLFLGLQLIFYLENKIIFGIIALIVFLVFLFFIMSTTLRKQIFLKLSKRKLAVLCRCSLMFFFYTIYFFTPFYLLECLNCNNKEVGLVILIISMAYSFFSMLYGCSRTSQLSSHYLVLSTLIISSCIFILAIFLKSFPLVIVASTTAGIGFGIGIPQTIRIAFSYLEEQEYGRIAGFFFTASFLASSIAPSIASMILNVVEGNQSLQEILESYEILRLSPLEISFLLSLILVLAMNFFLIIGSAASIYRDRCASSKRYVTCK